MTGAYAEPVTLSFAGHITARTGGLVETFAVDDFVTWEVSCDSVQIPMSPPFSSSTTAIR